MNFLVSNDEDASNVDANFLMWKYHITLDWKKLLIQVECVSTLYYTKGLTMRSAVSTLDYLSSTNHIYSNKKKMCAMLIICRLLYQ